jgi:hypothetical protein
MSKENEEPIDLDMGLFLAALLVSHTVVFTCGLILGSLP